MGVTYASTVPSMIDADAIRALRLDGAPPCADGLDEALRWIGSRSLPIAEAIEEARGKLTPSNYEWAFRALGLFGYGSVYGYGYGCGYGCGYGDGSGSGSGSGSGDGDGYGDGYGYGYGYGCGYGDGDGYGDGVDAKEVGDETAR